jgi:hypothetical protein
LAESCPGTTCATLSWLQAWHIRDETCSAALAELVHVQDRHAFVILDSPIMIPREPAAFPRHSYIRDCESRSCQGTLAGMNLNFSKMICPSTT